MAEFVSHKSKNHIVNSYTFIGTRTVDDNVIVALKDQNGETVKYDTRRKAGEKFLKLKGGEEITIDLNYLTQEILNFSMAI